MTKESNPIIFLNIPVFIACIFVQLVFAWLSINDLVWIVIGIIGITFGFSSWKYSEDKIFIIIGFGFIMLLCYIYVLWLYLVYYNLFVLYGVNMPITYLGIIGIVFSLVIIILFGKNLKFKELLKVPISLNFSILNSILFVICIMVQLIYAWLSIKDAIWIIFGIIGLSFGFIYLFISYNKIGAGIGFGFIMFTCYCYILWLYLIHYNLFALYGINMPIAYTGLSGLVCSVIIIIKFFTDSSNRGYPPNPINIIYSKIFHKILAIVNLLSASFGLIATVISFIPK